MKYTILGGGSAGWLTALFIRKICPDDEITVIASSEIGILGAGEGTTPQFPMFLKRIDISINDIIKNAKGTIKNGIKFTNWNGDGEHYYHAFQDSLINFKDYKNIDVKPYALNNISNHKNLDNLNFTPTISEKCKVKYIKSNDKQCGSDALHFDANLLAKYLQTVGLQRNIKLIDDEVISVDSKDNKIVGFKLKSENKLDTDFVFDCSGFKRVLIGEHYKGKWNSYSDHLPMKRAMPFFIQNNTKEIPPYTESIAMKYGWVWKIPVQGRFGCGYVFDSDLVSDEEIKKELKEYFGHEIISPRTFTFKPGCFEDVCMGNCIAIGLSAAFIEPLEATSIWVSIMQLTEFETSRDKIVNGDIGAIRTYNQIVNAINRDILNFIQLHYLTNRNDSIFWNTFKVKNEILPQIERFKEICQEKIPEVHDLKYLTLIENVNMGCSDGNHDGIFSETSWQQVGAGIKFFNGDVARRVLDTEYTDFKNEVVFENFFEKNSDLLYDHYNYIEKLKNV